MNFADAFSFATKATSAMGTLQAYESEGRTALRALTNALASCGCPVHRVVAHVTRFGMRDPAALAEALRTDPEIRRWVWEWSDGQPQKPARRRKRNAPS